MRKNYLEEPGANADQLFELAINLKNARTFAGKGPINGDWDWREGEWWDLEDEDPYYNWEPKPEAKAQGTYGKFAQQIANGGRVGLADGSPEKKIFDLLEGEKDENVWSSAWKPTPDKTHQLMSWLLKPENLERLKKNKGLVRQLTKMKVLPSSVRLYLRNLAGVTDKITEDFFSKSELKEIKKRVSEAKAMGSMGYVPQSGATSSQGANVIGYAHVPKNLKDSQLMSLKGAFTNPAININMTLGQATFDTDKDGNVVVKDIHDFHGIEGYGYEGKQLRKKTFKQVVPHPYEKGSIMDTLVGDVDISRVSKTEESDKQFLKRAHKELLAGSIDPAKYARVVAGLEQGEGIPVEIDVGKISHEDKLKASPDFADYIAQDTKSGYGVEYEDVGIPMKIREDARKYAQQIASGGRVGYQFGQLVQPGLGRQGYSGKGTTQRNALSKWLLTQDKTITREALTKKVGEIWETLHPRKVTSYLLKENPEIFKNIKILSLSDVKGTTDFRNFLKTTKKRATTVPQLLADFKKATGKTVDANVGNIATEFSDKFNLVTSKNIPPNKIEQKAINAYKKLSQEQKFAFQIGGPSQKGVYAKWLTEQGLDSGNTGQTRFRKLLEREGLYKKAPIKTSAEIAKKAAERTAGIGISGATTYEQDLATYKKNVLAKLGIKADRVPFDLAHRLSYKHTARLGEKYTASNIGTDWVRTNTSAARKLEIALEPLYDKQYKLRNKGKKLKTIPKDLSKELDKVNNQIAKLVREKSNGRIQGIQIDPYNLKVGSTPINYKYAADLGTTTKPLSQITKGSIDDITLRLNMAEQIKNEALESGLIKKVPKNFNRGIGSLAGKSALRGARFIPGLGIVVTAGLAGYGLYDAVKKGYTKPSELLASAAWGSGVEFEDKDEETV